MAPAITAQPQNQEGLASGSVTFSVSVNGSAPLRYQWEHDGKTVEGGTNSMFTLNNLQPEDAGAYSVTVFNDAGSVTSQSATLSVRFGAFIFTHPASATRRVGESVTFSVSAYTESTLTYQWRFNGSPIAGANSASYTINSAQYANTGTYDVVLTDAAGTVVSAPATLLILIDPVIVQNPLSQTIATGGMVRLSVQVTNTATLPIGYRWRVASTTAASNNLSRHFDFFTVSNVVGISNITVVVANLSQPGGRISTTAAVSGVADFDRDGMADAWEASFGLSTNSTDLTLDSDNDKMTNLAEYLAGTNPTNALSYFKVDEIDGGGGARITFGAISNRTYTVQFSESFTTSNTWSPLTHFVARATNRVESFIDAAGANRLYRLVTPAQ